MTGGVGTDEQLSRGLPAHDHTERLCLRRPAGSDLADITRIHQDPATNTHNPNGPASPEYCRGILDAWIEHWRCGVGYWCVRTTESGPVIGVGGVRPLNAGTGFNLYYRFAPQAWGHGYATELACHAVERISQGGPTEIVALIRAENESSIAVALRAGLLPAGSVSGSSGVQLRFAVAR